MKKFLLIIVTGLFITYSVNAQQLKIFSENKSQGFIIYGSNPELYPMSISLDLDIKNLAFSEKERKVFVIPPKSDKFKIGELTIIETGGRIKFSYTYKSAFGDVTLTGFDSRFEYDLPFQKGKSYKVYQGYNGSFSHKNQNAIDFTMAEGTEILTARGGIIVQLVQNNTESCPREDCRKYNNYITVMHNDGTFANYSHIRYNGSVYKLGDPVKKGVVIAYSGNVGWTSGPHLHFSCFSAGFEKMNSIETKFRIEKGDKAVLLTEGNTYLRDY